MSNTSLYTTIVTQNVASNNLTTLYSSGASLATVQLSYGNSNVQSFLNIGTDGGNTIANIIASGNITAQNFIGNFSGNITGNITVPGANTDIIYNNNGNAGASNNFTFNQSTNVATVVGNIVANNFIGSGNNLSNIQASNVTGLGNIATLNLNGSNSQVLYGNGIFASVGNGNYATNSNFANYAGNVTVSNQPNITSVGTLSNLRSNGNITFTNNAQVNIGSNTISVTANSQHDWNGLFLVDNVEAVLYGNTVIIETASVSGGVKDWTFTSSGNLVLPGNTFAVNYANGTQVNINSVANANFSNYAGNVTVSAQPNITSVGTLTSLSVTGNISSGNANLGNTTRANYFIGSGNNLSNIQASNITGTIANANYSLYAGTVLTNAQPNITSVGTLTSLTVTNAINTGQIQNGNTNINLTANGNVVITAGGVNAISFANNQINILGSPLYANTIISNGNITSGNANLGNVVTANYTNAVLTTGAQPNITSIGTLSTNFYIGTPFTGYYGNWYAGNGDISTFGNITADGNIKSNHGTITGNFIGNAYGLVNIPAGNINGTVSTAFSASYANYTNYILIGEQPNITSIGTISTLVTVTGNLSSGNANLGGLATANYFSGNGYLLTGVISANAANSNFANYAGNVTVARQPNITSVGTLTGLTVNGDITSTGSGNISSGNANLGNAIRGNYFIGSGNNLSNIQASNITGNISNANYSLYAGTVLTNAQPNITSVGTLTSLSVTGNISSGNANLGNAITGNYFIGNGYYLTYMNGANVAGNVFYAMTSNFANYAGNVTIASQPNITSVGTLISLSVTGNISSGNANLGNAVVANYHIGSGNNLSNIQGSNVSGAVAFATTANSVAVANVVGIGNIATLNLNGNSSQVLYGNGVFATVSNGASSNFANFAGNITVASQPNITSVGTLTSLSVTGNISSGNANLGNAVVANYHIGSGNNLSNIQASNITGTIANANYSLYAGTVLTNAQPNITSVGTLVSLSVTGNISSGNANLGNAITGNYFIGSGNNLSNIQGSNVTGNVTSAITSNFANFAGNVTVASQSNITSVGTLTSLSVTGNLTSGNANLGNLVVANYFSGDGSLLTGITGTSGFPISNGNSNINAVANGNVFISSAGNANILVITGTGANISGTANITGNVSAPFFIGNGSALTGVTATATPGGSNTQLQYNNNGSFNGISTVTWNGSNLNLGAVGNVKITGGSNNYLVLTDGTGNLSFNPFATNLTVGTRSTSVYIPITSYTMNVQARTGNVLINVN